MFHTSSQRKHWMFSDRVELKKIRVQVNSDYIEKFRESSKNEVVFLTPDEEKVLIDYYQLVLADLQGKFQPPMPNAAIATAIAYMKRFYLKTSVMDHPPREMYLVFLYMACKVEEYNISAEKFVCILPADRREKALDFILSHELLLMKRLDFHMNVHNAYRPMEGFIIDMKTRQGVNPDSWRPKAEHFLLLSLHTDACFFYPPSQLALAALHTGCENNDVINYMMLLGNSDASKKLIEQVRSIVAFVTSHHPQVKKDQVKALEQTLKGCRNPETKKRPIEEKIDSDDDNDSQEQQEQSVVPMEIIN